MVLTPQELAAKVGEAQNSAIQPAPTMDTPAVAPIQDTINPVTTVTPVTTPSTDKGIINIGNGKIINKASKQYQAAIGAGWTEEEIIKSLQKKQQAAKPVVEQKTDTTATVDNAIAPVKPTAVPQEVTPLDYQTSEQQRADEIINNLNKYKQTNPSMFTDREIYNKTFAYNNRGDFQKQLLDNWYQNNIEKATETAGLARQLSTDIASSYVDGKLSENDLTKLQQTDPAKYAEVQTKINEQNIMKKYSSLLYGDQKEEDKTSPVNAITQQINDLLSKTTQSDIYDEYQKAISSPEMTDLSNTVINKEGEIKQIDEQINATQSELEAQFKNSGISQTRLNAIMQDQVQLLQNKRNGLALEYQTAQAKYSNKLAVIKESMDIKEKQYAMQQQQEQSMVQKLSFAYGIYSDQQKRTDAMNASDLQFKRDMEVMNLKYEKDFNQAVRIDKLQNGDINSADPYVVEKAISKNVDSMMAQYDGLITSSRDQLIERIKSGMKEGKSYGNVLGEITKDIQGKKEYSQWRNNKLGIDTKPMSLGNGLVWRNGKAISEQQFRDANNIPSAVVESMQQQINVERQVGGYSQYDDPTTVQKVLNDDVLGLGKNCGLQCAGYTSAIASKLGINVRFGSTPESKDNAIMTIGLSPVPVVGGFVSLNTGAPQGHTGYVTEVSPDGKRVKVSNSNYSGTAEKPNNVVTENWFNVSSIRKASIAPGKGSPINNNTASTATPAELAMFAKGAQYIGKEGGLSQQRYNQIALQQQNIQSNEPSNDPLIMSSIEMPGDAKETQVKSKTYADRMNYAVNSLIDIEKEYASKSKAGQTFQEYAPNFAKSQNQQFLDIAKQNFITASLRQESGAAISPSEFAKEEKKYFPQIGDTTETVKAKQRAREFAIRAMYSQAGNTVGGKPVSSYYKERNIDSLWNNKENSTTPIKTIDYGWGGSSNNNSSYAGYASTLYSR